MVQDNFGSFWVEFFERNLGFCHYFTRFMVILGVFPGIVEPFRVVWLFLCDSDHFCGHFDHFCGNFPAFLSCFSWNIPLLQASTDWELEFLNIHRH